jgi:glycyl-tRNA synthetase beta chain
MPQFLLELFSEEIPARMQKRAAEDLKKLLMDALTKAGFLPGGMETFSAPRRLVAVVEGLPERTADVREERKGPKVDAPAQAIEGFLRGAGLTNISLARVVSDPKKGDFYVADLVKPGRATPDALAEIVPDIIRNFPWPKSMRWGEGTLRWVRPLHRILALFDGEIVPFDVDGIVASNISEGHRFHGAGTFEVKDFEDYEAKLSAAHVVLDRDQRKAQIKADAQTLCHARNLELIDDEGLLEEVCGLVDEPHVIMGDMDPSFLDLPPEVIRLTLRVNQKYFVVRDPKTGGLAPHFIIVSNVKATDGGKKIALGNARVLAARLNDARYFWDLDRKASLESRVPKLDTLVFHQELGSVGEKVGRIEAIAGGLAQNVKAKLEDAKRAARLAKADLTTEMVGEFPELQGVMGRYYQLQQGGSEASNQVIADAIRDHYKPIGPSDQVPREPVAMAVALADKLDTISGFFAINEKPTGSADPFALRRAALGVIRVIRTNEIRLELRVPIIVCGRLHMADTLRRGAKFHSSVLELMQKYGELADKPGRIREVFVDALKASDLLYNDLAAQTIPPQEWEIEGAVAILNFILERLRVSLRDEGFAPDVLEAAFAIPDDDIVRIVDRVTALAKVLKTEDGANLVAGLKRGANILRAEEKKGGAAAQGEVSEALLAELSEKGLFLALRGTELQIEHALAIEQFDLAMSALAELRGPVDRFFENVLVNDADAAIRQNRLALLVKLRTVSERVADFSKLAGA